MRQPKFLFVLVVVAIALASIPQAAVAEADPISQVTAKFWWWTPEVAVAAGFKTDGTCVDASVTGRPELGAMGIHYVKQEHVDGTFNPLEPEALMFAPGSNKLVGVEYMVTSKTRPAGFGQAFDPDPRIPDVWGLHMSLVENKSGRFSPWNPSFTCAKDPTRATVLVGEASLDDIRIKLELEPPKAMSMLMSGNWTEMAASDGKYHVEVKPEDPKTNNRIPYAQVVFSATNRDTGENIDLILHPMWGSSGLHYAANGDLPDGVYVATVLVGVPTFARAGADRDRWTMPSQARFEFKLDKGLLVSSDVLRSDDGPMMQMPQEVPEHLH
ncbi:MAG: hypothetical protein HYY30_10650 [Chloroflexi bacterium]|nr:hypothetical protein [Chloroflexota bacterium]